MEELKVSPRVNSFPERNRPSSNSDVTDYRRDGGESLVDGLFLRCRLLLSLVLSWTVMINSGT